MKIIIEAVPEEIAALINKLTQERPSEEPSLFPPQTGKPIKGISIPIDPVERSQY